MVITSNHPVSYNITKLNMGQFKIMFLLCKFEYTIRKCSISQKQKQREFWNIIIWLQGNPSCRVLNIQVGERINDFLRWGGAVV